MSNKFRVRIKGNYCVYCGEPADTDEHWPPRSYTLYGYLLPACLECNIIASDRFPNNFRKRAAFVRDMLEHKYGEALFYPDWNENELEEMSEKFKEETLEWQKRKNRLEKRIAWSAIAYIAYIDHNNVFVRQFASSVTIAEKLGVNCNDLGSSKNNSERNLLKNRKRATVYQPLAELAMIKRYQETGDIEILNKWGAIYGEKYDAIRKK